MGVYIKGMEMPKTCEECCLESFCNLWIEAIKMSGVELKVGAKATICHPNCPLIPVPPHGKLIDADEFCTEHRSLKLLGRVGIRRFNWHVAAAAFVEDAPTIIPADKE